VSDFPRQIGFPELEIFPVMKPFEESRSGFYYIIPLEDLGVLTVLVVGQIPQ
jgi:hypothetical protein